MWTLIYHRDVLASGGVMAALNIRIAFGPTTVVVVRSQCGGDNELRTADNP